MEVPKKISEFAKNHEKALSIGFLVLFAAVVLMFRIDLFLAFLTDRGREFLFPSEILHGKVLYKDILCIYNPGAYLVNAFAMLLFGEKMSSVLAFATGSIFVTISFFYLLCREFFDNRTSIAFSMFIAVCSMFGGSLFNFVSPYSYSMTYGLMFSVVSTFLGVKFIKSGEGKFLYSANIFAGLAFAMKAEFLPLLPLLILSSTVLKKSSFKTTALSTLSWFAAPVAAFGILMLQGATVSDFLAAKNFLAAFASTPSMATFYANTGALPSKFGEECFFRGLFEFAVLAVVGYFLLKLKGKTPLFYALCAVAVFLPGFCGNDGAYLFFTWLPIATALLLVLTAKKLFETDRPLLFLTLCALSLSIKTFFVLVFTKYGEYTIILLLPAFTAVAANFFDGSKFFKTVDFKRYMSFLAIIFTIFYSLFLYVRLSHADTELKTDRGRILTTRKTAAVTSELIDYIDATTRNDDKLLVLPEGHMINFLTGRKIDTKLHMLDTLYYDAMGDKKAGELLRSADYDVIVTCEGFDFSHFGGNRFPHDIENSSVKKYLDEAYYLDKTIVSELYKSKDNTWRNVFRCYRKKTAKTR